MYNETAEGKTNLKYSFHKVNIYLENFYLKGSSS